MTAPCTSPLSAAQLVDYWTDELDDVECASIEEHLFSCATCTSAMERIQRVVGAVRGGLGPVISPDQLAELRAAGLTIEENTFTPGVPREVVFPASLDMMIHHLGGLALANADRVSVTVRAESTGMVVHEDPFAPFDRGRGEVLIACQKHFVMLPHDIVIDVRVHRGAQPSELATYAIPHVFPA